VKTMTVGQLIEKLSVIEDKSLRVVFRCGQCGEYQEIDDMRVFGFVVPAQKKGDEHHEA
jgi:hypothetical protein